MVNLDNKTYLEEVEELVLLQWLLDYIVADFKHITYRFEDDLCSETFAFQWLKKQILWKYHKDFAIHLGYYVDELLNFFVPLSVKYFWNKRFQASGDYFGSPNYNFFLYSLHCLYELTDQCPVVEGIILNYL